MAHLSSLARFLPADAWCIRSGDPLAIGGLVVVSDIDTDFRIVWRAPLNQDGLSFQRTACALVVAVLGVVGCFTPSNEHVVGSVHDPWRCQNQPEGTLLDCTNDAECGGTNGTGGQWRNARPLV